MKRQLLRRPEPAILFLAILALALYLPGFTWGVPQATAPDRVHSWGVDAPIPLGPLAEMHNIIQPKPDRLLGYPLMHSIILSTLYVPYLAFLWMSGGLRGMSAIYPFGLADPAGALRNLSLIAHFAAVLIGVGTVVAAYDTAKTMWNRATGIWAALFAMMSFPMFYYSRVGNVDGPMLFFAALALAAYARIVKNGFSPQRAAWLGAFCGLSLATKEQAFAMFLGFAVGVLWLQWRREQSFLAPEFLRSAAIGLVATFFVYGAGSGLFIDPDRFFAHIEFARERTRALAAGEVALFTPFPFTWQGHVEFAQRIWGYLADCLTISGVLLALCGVIFAIWREPLALPLVFPLVTYLGILFLTARVAQLRYLMPAAFLLAFFAARAATAALTSNRVVVRFTVTGLAAGVALVCLLRGIDLTYAMVQDSRYAAGSWLAEQTTPGDRVESFGPSALLPPLKAGIESALATPFLGLMKRSPTDDQASMQIADGWRQRKPKFIVVQPDYTSTPGMPYSASCPPQVYQNLMKGTYDYRLVAFFETPRLFSWIRRPLLDYPTVNPPIRIFALSGNQVASK